MTYRAELPDNLGTSWVITLLGEFSARRNGERLIFPPSVGRLIAFLALHPRIITRVQVAGSLWIDHSQQGAYASLRSTLWRLRGLAPGLVVTDNLLVGLAPQVSVDFRLAMDLADHLDQQSLSYVDPAWSIDNFGLELLPGWSDDWATLARERHRQRSLHALESIVRHLTQIAQYGLAIDLALTAIELDQFRESAHRALIDVHLAEGNYSEALRCHAHYRELIESELGILPSPLLTMPG